MTTDEPQAADVAVVSGEGGAPVGKTEPVLPDFEGGGVWEVWPPPTQLFAAEEPPVPLEVCDHAALIWIRQYSRFRNEVYVRQLGLAWPL